MKAKWTTRAVAETESLGRAIGERLLPGDVVLLRGELGAGKTVLSRGIARGLGIEGVIASPTYTLLHCHEGEPPLHHFDLYRLDGAGAFDGAGLADFLGGDAVSLVEWPERCEAVLPASCLEIAIAYGAEENERVITLLPKGGFREVRL